MECWMKYWDLSLQTLSSKSCLRDCEERLWKGRGERSEGQRAGKNGDWIVRWCGKWQHGNQRGVGEHVLRLNVLTCDAFALPKGLLPPTAPPHHGKVHFTHDYVGPVGAFTCGHWESDYPAWVIGCRQKKKWHMHKKRNSEAGNHSAWCLT